MFHFDRSMSRTLDVYAMADSGAVLEFDCPLAALPRLADLRAQQAGTVKLRWHGRRDAQGRPAAVVRIRADLVLRCDRCDAPLGLSVDETRDFWFVRSENELAALPIDDTADEPLLGSDRFAIDTLIEDEIILSLPISPRHAACPVEASAAALGTPGGANDIEPAKSAEPAETPRTHRPFATLVDWRGRKPS